MAHKSFSLQINEPCSQNWDSMSIQEKGRFCASCSKIVVDFTTMSDIQVKTFFKNYTGEVCGRLHTHQLQTNYTYYAPRPWYTSRFMQYALAGLLTLQTADSIAGGSTVPMEQSPIINNNPENQQLIPDSDVKRIIEGKVINPDGEKGIKDVVVTIAETGQTVQTTANGKFKFEIPADFTGTQIKITFSRPGYQSASEEISLLEIRENIVVRMYERKNIKMGKVHYKEN